MYLNLNEIYCFENGRERAMILFSTIFRHLLIWLVWLVSLLTAVVTQLIHQPPLHHLDNPPTLPLAPKRKLHVHFIGFGVGMESFLWWFCPKVSSENYFLYIHTTTHDSQYPLPPLCLWELSFQCIWLPMGLIECMAPKLTWWNAMIVYDHAQLLQSPP